MESTYLAFTYKLIFYSMSETLTKILTNNGARTKAAIEQKIFGLCESKL